LGDGDAAHTRKVIAGSESFEKGFSPSLPIAVAPWHEQPASRSAKVPVQTILVAVDGSDLSTRALGFAIERALLHKAEIVVAFAVNRLPVAVVTATPYAYADPTPLLEALEAEAEAVLGAAEASVRASGVPVRRAKLDGPAGEEILALAAGTSADLIVMGTHGRRGLYRMAVGSTAEHVIRGATVPVFVVTQACEKLPGARALSHVLVAVDGSPASHAAVTFASELARVEGCRITLCNVVEPPSHWDDLDRSALLAKELEDHGRAELDAECARAAAFGAPVDSLICIGDATSSIVAEAQKAEADCIVLGTHGRAGIPRFVIGSVAEGVLRSSHLPVCTIRSR
jgi:nucleotide-binding universal stress UspA family protein